MKKYILMLTILVVSLLADGCSSVERNSYKAIGSIAITVDAAVSAWYDYRASGFATVEQDAKIKALYTKYQAAMTVAHDTEKSLKSGIGSDKSYNEILQGVAAIGNDLIDLIHQFNPSLNLKKVRI